MSNLRIYRHSPNFPRQDRDQGDKINPKNVIHSGGWQYAKRAGKKVDRWNINNRTNPEMGNYKIPPMAWRGGKTESTFAETVWMQPSWPNLIYFTWPAVCRTCQERDINFKRLKSCNALGLCQWIIIFCIGEGVRGGDKQTGVPIRRGWTKIRLKLILMDLTSSGKWNACHLPLVVLLLQTICN